MPRIRLVGRVPTPSPEVPPRDRTPDLLLLNPAFYCLIYRLLSRFIPKINQLNDASTAQLYAERSST